MGTNRLSWLLLVLGAIDVTRGAAQVGDREPPAGWAWTPVVSTASPLRVLVLYDMEGISGIDRLAMTTCADPGQYAAGQARLVADVNAVVEGLVAAGVGTVHVIDRHGSGCDSVPDLPTPRLHPGAAVVDEKSQPFINRVMERQWDALALVGAHPSPGWDGFLEHVGSFGFERILNGLSVSESEQHGRIFGLSGIPVIFASGDDRLRQQLRERMPWVTYVEVKRATSRSSAALLPPATVRAALIDSARIAVARRNDARLLTMVPPFTGGYRPVWPLTLEPLTAIPGVDVSAGVIRVTGGSPQEVNAAINRIAGLVAGVHTSAAFWDAAARDPKLDRYRDSLFMVQWLAGPPATKSVPR